MPRPADDDVDNGDDDGLGGPTALTPVAGHGADQLAAAQLQLLVIGDGSFAAHTIPEANSVRIGRSPRCEISIQDDSLSRQHAMLHVADRLTIEDLGSSNGTIVRGVKISPGEAIPIAIGEVVGLGSISIMLQRRSRAGRPIRVWTHDYFEARLQEECARVERGGGAFALLRITPLEPIAASVEDALAELFRESDTFGKCGDDYEVMLPDTDTDQAQAAIRRIQNKLQARRIQCRVGVACCPRDGRRAYQLFAKLQPIVAGDKPAIDASGIVVADTQMQSLHQLVRRIASSQISVLLLGETGVGKEVFARAIHQESPRASGPFVQLNCAALTESLLESELFGHEKGAFTNAMVAKPGLIETADGGTLLLDEIGDMPMPTQAKLLRVIEDSQVRRVGGLKSRAINVRFVAATNNDLETMITRGSFRRDLFFRLNGVTIVIPPLRERLGELELLANAFIRRATPEWPQPPTLAPEAMELMKSYSWPGNVRELKHMMERAALLCGGTTIRAEHLPAEKMRASPITKRPGEARAPTNGHDAVAPRTEGVAVATPPRGSADEERWIMQALERAGGNQTVAARLLGMSRRTLVNRLNEHKSLHRPRKSRKQPAED